MIFHPAILALLLGSILVSLMIAYSAGHAFAIVRKWDLRSGSELQLALERKTYLVSTLLAYVFGFELLSFFLFIFMADELQPLFIGAMCAAGSLNVNPYGYPTLILRLVNFLLFGLWLILNHVDHKVHDYPLTRIKYIAFLLLAPLVLIEAGLQANYFLRLKPDVITSCCGTLFKTGGTTLPSLMGGVQRVPAMVVFYAIILSAAGSGIIFLRKAKGGILFSSLSALAFAWSVVSLFSFISIYIYELPSHHCPFCMLQREYGYIGYLLYITLLGGTIAGLAVGMLEPFRKRESLAAILPSIQRRLALTSIILFFLFAGIVAVRILFSNLKM